MTILELIGALRGKMNERRNSFDVRKNWDTVASGRLFRLDELDCALYDFVTACEADPGIVQDVAPIAPDTVLASAVDGICRLEKSLSDSPVTEATMQAADAFRNLHPMVMQALALYLRVVAERATSPLPGASP